MLMVRSIEKLSDGIRLTPSSGVAYTLTSADIPSAIKSGTIASLQTWISNWFFGKGFHTLSKVYTVTPLNCDIVISSQPIVGPVGIYVGWS